MGARTRPRPRAMTRCCEHLLLYEPRTEGHHLAWLGFIVEDLLSAGFRLSLAADLRPQSAPLVHDRLGGMLQELKLFSAYDNLGKRHQDAKAGSVAYCLRHSGAERVFLCAFDEIASDCWRRAAFGGYPPRELHGKLGGIYHRPRFMAAPRWSPNRWMKQLGFRRLLNAGWMRPLLFVDEYLARERAAEFPQTPIFFLPCPCPSGLTGDRNEACRKLGIPTDKTHFLFYGTGARRKGLHLAVEAMLSFTREMPAFLLCAGKQDPAGATGRGLGKLIETGRARLLDRYVSDEEERLVFAAADLVLLPYVHHFGTSAVLYQAMAAGKMVIASDEELLGRLTREHQLGLLFPSGNARALAARLKQAVEMTAVDRAAFKANGARFAEANSRETYRRALLSALA